MNNLLTEYQFNLTEILSIGIAILSLMFSIYIYFKTKKTKSIGYHILHNHFLLENINELNSELDITYKNRKINNLYYFSIQIGNTGKTIIEKNDFLDNILIRFNNHAKILNCEINTFEAQPSQLKLSTNDSKDTLNVSPLFLNSQDFFTLDILIADFSNFVSIKGRIKGIKRIKKINYKIGPFFPLFFLGIALLILAGQSIIKEEKIVTQTITDNSFAWFTVPLLILGFILLSIAIFDFLNPQFDRKWYNIFSFSKPKYRNPNPPHIGTPFGY